MSGQFHYLLRFESGAVSITRRMESDAGWLDISGRKRIDECIRVHACSADIMQRSELKRPAANPPSIDFCNRL